MRSRADDKAKDAKREPTTVRPPFDPEQFARESESSIRIDTASPPLSGRPTAPPPAGLPQYTAAIVPEAIPVLAVAHEDVEWFELTPLARSLLRDVNGKASVQAICTRSGTRVENAIVAFRELEREGIVSWK